MAERTLVYIGTYTGGKSEGIYVYHVDPSSGALEYVSEAKGIVNPSFLDIDPSQRYLYAVNEVKELEGKPTGGVSAFSINPKSGELAYLNTKPSHGIDPCHLCVDKTAKYVLVANYGSGTVCVLPIEKDGLLGNETDFVQHKGSSVTPKRQEGPHAHSVNLDPANRYAFVPDLGLDRIMIYKFDSIKGKLTPNVEPSAKVKAGAAPRHFTFHPSERYAYLINEIDSTIVAYTCDTARGALKELQTVPALPEDFKGTSYAADIHVTPSGKFLYGSNRGHDSLVIYRINQRTGKLTYISNESTRGKTPRNFNIDPTGTFLLAANQGTDTIVTFRIDHNTGKLTPMGNAAEVPTPVCVKFLKLSQA